MLRALSRPRPVDRRGFTLVEMVVTVIIIALLTGIAVMSYSMITANTKRDQARTLLRSVAAAQQSWYRARGSYVSFTGSTNTTHSPTDTQAGQLLRRIAPGSDGVPANYLTAATAPTRFGDISVGTSASNNWPLLVLSTQSATGECAGAVVVPSGSGLTGWGPDIVPAGKVASCSANAIKAWRDIENSATTPTTVPGTPKNLVLTPGPGRIVLTWDAPTSDGTNDPSTYVITYADGTPVASVDAGITSYVDGASAPLDKTKSYSYKVIAHNASGDSQPAVGNPASATPLDPATVAPDRPTSLVAAWNPGGPGVHLSWAPATSGGATNATGYEIRRDGATIACLGSDVCVGHGGSGQLALSTAYDDTYTGSPSLQLGATYTYDLRTLNPLGSSVWTTVTVTTPPAAPTGVSALALPGSPDPSCGAPACVRVTWTAPPAPSATGGYTPTAAPVLGYRVYRCTSPACDVTNTSAAVLAGTVDASAGTTFTDSTLPGQSALYYKVVAFNANTTASQNASAAAAVTTVAAAPTVTGIANAPGQVSLSWTPPSGVGTVTGYQVYRLDADGTPVPIATTPGTATGYVDTGADLPAGALTAFTTYTYRVAVITAAGVGIPSSNTAVLTKIAPIRGAAVVMTTTTGALTWTRQPNVTYTITRSPGGLSASTTLGHYTDTGLTPGTAYSYTLTGSAADTTNTQVSTPVVTLSTATVPGPPTGLSATPSGQKVTLTWAAPSPGSTVSTYNIYRCTGVGCTPTTQVAQVGGATTTWSESNLAVGTAYTYGVTAVTAGGEGITATPAGVATIPAAVTATATGGAAGVTLNWTPSPVATSFDILRNGVWLATVPGTLTTFTDGSGLGGLTYSYVVRAKNNAGSVDSAPVSAAGNPDPATGLSATPGPTQITLSWLTQGADGFQLVRCAGQNCDVSTAPVVATITTGSTRSYVDTGLTAQAWYTYALRTGRATVSGGTTTWAWSALSTPVTAKTILDPPSGLNVTSVTSTSVSLSWGVSAGASSYRIYRNGTAVATVNGLSTTTYTDSTVAPGTPYTYTVTAVASNGDESAQSNQVSATTPLDTPTGLTAGTVTTTTIPLTWNAVPGATSYEVVGCVAPCSTGGSYGTVTSPSFTVTGLQPGTSYTLWVRAKTAYVTSADSASLTVSTRPISPAPTNVTITSPTGTSFVVTWSAPSSYTLSPALTYQVQVTTTDSGAVSTPCTGITATSCTVSGLNAGTSYTVTVRSYDTFSYSPWTAPVAAATVPGTPTLSGSISAVTATLSWTSAGPDVTYSISRNGTVVASGLAGGSTTLTLPARGTTYALTVTAMNAVGISGGTSNTVSLTTMPPDPTTAPTVAASGHNFVVTLPALAAATQYSICRSMNNGACTWMATVTGTTWTDPGTFTGGASYQYAYYGTNGAGSTATSPYSAAIKPSYDTAVWGDSPALYYRMNENPAFAGYNPIVDASGNGHNGTVQGTPVPGPNLAKGSLGSLDMSGQAGGSNPITLPINTAAGTYVTFEATVTFPSTVPASGSMPLATGTSSLYMPPQGSFGFNAGYGTVYGMTAAQVSSTLLGGTHHIVGVFKNGANMNTAGNGCQLYVDGVAQTMSVVVGYNTNLTMGGSFTIGNSGSNTYAWDGAIDNVAVYNGALAAATITNHFNASDQAAAIKASAPIGFWPLNDPPIVDSSGNNRTGGFVRSPKAGAATGPLGFGTVGGVNINGNSSAALNLPVNTAAGAFTSVDMIVQFPASGLNSMPFQSIGGDSLWLHGADASFGFNTGHGDLYGFNATPLLGGVHRVTAVFYNGAYTGNNKLYIDGVAQTLTQLYGTANSATISNTITIGGAGTLMPQVNYSYRWNGAIADAAIYNGALSPAQVTAHQNGGASGDNATALLADSPIGFYRLNDFAAADSSGNNRSGTYDPASGANYGTAGALSNSADTGINFAGPTNSGSGTDDPGLSYGGAGLASGSADRTWEFWARQPSGVTNNTVWAGQGASGANLWVGYEGTVGYWNSPFYPEGSQWSPVTDWGLVGPSNTRSTSAGATFPVNTFPDSGAHVVWDHPYSATELMGWQVFRRTFTLTSSVTATLTATADDRPNVWVDGTQVISSPNTTSSWNQNLSATVTLGPGKHVIMAGIVNASPNTMTNGGAAGFALTLMNGASVVADATDGSPIHSDATWHYFNVKTSVPWTDVNYWNDVANVWYKSYWEPVKDEATASASPWVATTNVTNTGTTTGTKWSFTNAHWIWAGSTSSTSSVPVGDVYFRKKVTVTSAGNFGFNYTADDSMDLYVDGVLKASKTSAWQDYDGVTVALSAGDHEIAVKAHNSGSGAGLLMAINQASGGSQTFQTDSSWIDSDYQSAVPGNSYSVDTPPNAIPVGALMVASNASGGSKSTFMSAPGLDNGGWHMVDLTVSGTTVSLYTDGVLTDVETFPSLGTAAGAALELNGYPWGASDTGGPIGMDEFAMYNKALTASQVAAHYAAAF